jgi:hypothetical protein
VIEVRLHLVTRAIGDRLRPAPEGTEAIQVAGVIGQIAGVAVSLPGELTVVARVMVNPEATFSQIPAIVG